MPHANPREASDSTMELGRGLQRTKDSQKKRDRNDIWTVFVMWHVCANDDLNRWNIQCLVPISKSYLNSMQMEDCNQSETRQFVGDFKVQQASQIILN